MPRRQPLRLAAGLLAALAVTGCGRSVAIDPVPADPACTSLVDALPDRIGGQPRKDATTPGTAAWGDPPITVRCGVPMPTAYSPTSQLLDVEGIDWLSEAIADGSRFTSVRTAPRIELTVPAAHEPASAALVDLSRALRELAQPGSPS